MSVIEATSLGSLDARVEPRTAALRSSFCECVDLEAVPFAAWNELAGRAIEPNAFFHPDWALAVSRYARGKAGARALLGWDGPARGRLIGFLPVKPARDALKIPAPVLVAWQAYAPLTTPLLDRDVAEEGARGLIVAAAGTGARGLFLQAMTENGAAADALRRAALAEKFAPRALRRYARASLDATEECDVVLREALGSKKLKELRRQRNRLSDSGPVTFDIASSPGDVVRALDGFLELEASGWKGQRGTALGQDEGDTAFIRRAAGTLSGAGLFEIATLACNGVPVAAGLLLRHGRRAFFFKIAYDEASAKFSPGVQLTLDVTEHLCADSGIDVVDSTANADHPMIDRVWRSRIQLVDLLVPVRPGELPLTFFKIGFAAREFARGVLHQLRSLRGQRP